MRRQYHSRNVDGHELIWDIHRLVKLAKQIPVKQVPLSAIAELDECYWFEANTRATCRGVADHARLIQEADLAHPIILAADGRVMDGMHRVCKALVEGRSTIAAVQFERNPEPDHVDAAIDTLSYEEP
jgi:hypothetical protein